MDIVEFETDASKSFLKLDKAVQQQVLKYLANPELLKNPMSFGKALLHNKKGQWRYRVGDYRVVSRILKDKLVILVIDVDHRSKVYKG